MKNIIALLFGALLVASFPAHSASLNNETAGGVMNEMQRVNAAMKGMLGENDGLVTANLNLVKKNKLWQEQLDTRLKPLATPLVAKIKASKTEEARLAREIARYNRACGPTFDSKTPQYYKCMREKPVLDRVVRKHKRARTALIAEKKRFDDEWKSYADLINKNQKQINKNFARHLVIKDKVAGYEKTLEHYRTRLITLCSTADRTDDGESIHHCNSISWDGTRKNLPPLENILKGTRFFGK